MREKHRSLVRQASSCLDELLLMECPIDPDWDKVNEFDELCDRVFESGLDPASLSHVLATFAGRIRASSRETGYYWMDMLLVRCLDHFREVVGDRHTNIELDLFISILAPADFGEIRPNIVGSYLLELSRSLVGKWPGYITLGDKPEQDSGRSQEAELDLAYQYASTLSFLHKRCHGLGPELGDALWNLTLASVWSASPEEWALRIENEFDRSVVLKGCLEGSDGDTCRVEPYRLAETEGEWSFVVTSRGDAVVTGWRGVGEVALVPAMVGGFPTMAIGDAAFEGNNTLSSVKIPEGVVYLGYRSFASCISLADVDLPRTLRSIGEQSFAGCTSLMVLNVPEGVVYTGPRALDSPASKTHLSMFPEWSEDDEEDLFGEDANWSTGGLCDDLEYWNHGRSGIAHRQMPSTLILVGDYPLVAIDLESFYFAEEIVIPRSVIEIKDSPDYSGHDPLTIISTSGLYPQAWAWDEGFAWRAPLFSRNLEDSWHWSLKSEEYCAEQGEGEHLEMAEGQSGEVAGEAESLAIPDTVFKPQLASMRNRGFSHMNTILLLRMVLQEEAHVVTWVDMDARRRLAILFEIHERLGVPVDPTPLDSESDAAFPDPSLVLDPEADPSSLEDYREELLCYKELLAYSGDASTKEGFDADDEEGELIERVRREGNLIWSVEAGVVISGESSLEFLSRWYGYYLRTETGCAAVRLLLERADIDVGETIALAVRRLRDDDFGTSMRADTYRKGCAMTRDLLTLLLEEEAVEAECRRTALKPGNRLEVVDGPFVGKDVLVKSVESDAQAAIVELEMMGRKVELQIDASMLRHS